jgi:nucleotide-binding universal stress UspA family protein
MQTEILHGRPATALIREVLRSGHDLLIRAHARDAAVPRPRYGAIDMELFRQCPCPVWAAWAGSRTRPQRLLVAVNAAAEEVEEQALNRKIVEIALAIAPESASVVLLQAWTAFAEEILRSHSTAEQLAAYVEAAERRARGALDNLTATLPRGTARFRVEMLKGHPEEVIPQFVVSEGIDLVVMGTVARTGIAGLLIGNTAERLLQRLITSVLAVKPDGFVSPVRAEP